MAYYAVSETTLTNIANEIRSKRDVAYTMGVGEFAAEIAMIDGGAGGRWHDMYILPSVDKNLLTGYTIPELIGCDTFRIRIESKVGRAPADGGEEFCGLVVFRGVPITIGYRGTNQHNIDYFNNITSAYSGINHVVQFDKRTGTISGYNASIMAGYRYDIEYFK